MERINPPGIGDSLWKKFAVWETSLKERICPLARGDTLRKELALLGEDTR